MIDPKNVVTDPDLTPAHLRRREERKAELLRQGELLQRDAAVKLALKFSATELKAMLGELKRVEAR